jgi:hypothetical protein
MGVDGKRLAGRLSNAIDFGVTAWLDWPSLPMNNKKDEIIFGARRAGVTWLYAFQESEQLDSARAKAKRLGSSLSEMLCGPHVQDPKTNPRRFTDDDRESHGLKIQITECVTLPR